MFDELDDYKSNGHFFFSAQNDLENVCNAPKTGVGVYLVYALKEGRIELVFIGSGGKITQSGTRSGGMFDTIVNGKQFGDCRKRTWKEKLISQKIEAIDIYWFETFDKEYRDIPSFMEGVILQRFFELHERLPGWNMEF